MHYVSSVHQIRLNSSISDRTCCQQCRYCSSSVGCRWICHRMIHRYLSCLRPHSHVGGTGQLWMTPLGSVIFLSRRATQGCPSLLSQFFAALKGVWAQNRCPEDAFSQSTQSGFWVHAPQVNLPPLKPFTPHLVNICSSIRLAVWLLHVMLWDPKHARKCRLSEIFTHRKNVPSFSDSGDKMERKRMLRVWWLLPIIILLFSSDFPGSCHHSEAARQPTLEPETETETLCTEVLGGWIRTVVKTNT